MNLYEIPVTRIDGTAGTLAPYRGQVLLIVNVASLCTFTPQYAPLELLYRRHHAAGFSVLAFPCDQFAGQEPGSDAEVLAFCLREYDITFPLFSKVEVNGREAHPLYRHLKQSRPGILGFRAIKWNFTKFLVGRDGKVLDRFAPSISPGDIEPDIVRALEAPRATPVAAG